MTGFLSQDTFGRCAGFIIFDIDNGIPRKVDYLLNTFGHHSHGECDHQHEGGHHGHDALPMPSRIVKLSSVAVWGEEL